MGHCTDCGSTATTETETIIDPAATHREKTVEYCPDCGEVQ